MVNRLAVVLRAAACGALVGLAGCAERPSDPGVGGGLDSGVDDPAADLLLPLDDARLLRRLSLDLRGVLPTAAELDAVAADPDQVAVYRDAWLDGPQLEDRLVSMLGERFLTLLDVFQVTHQDYLLPGDQACAFERSVGEEPLRLMARVAVEDRPWTDVVTADGTVANELLAQVWPLDRSPGEGWQPATWTDGRPAAGILSSNGLWWRYVTSSSNANRSRAAAISNLLLCEDILTRPVTFSETPSLTDEDAIRDALATDPNCVGCHVVVDPLAAAMMGFYPAIDYNPLELGLYHPEREALAEGVLGVQPAWFGTPISGLVELGPHVAADPRFSRCATQTMAALLWRRPVRIDDHGRITALQQAFEDEEMRLKALLRAITDDPVYRAGQVLDPDLADQERTRRLLTPDQLASAVQDATGLAWTQDGCDQLANDDVGYRTLAGGVDGLTVVEAQAEAGLTWALVVKRLAQAAAQAAVQRDLVDGQAGEGSLFTARALDLRPGDADFDAELALLRWRLLATRDVDADAALADLWQDAFDQAGDAATAWTVVLSVLLRDPDFVSH